jgi:hypothetical protein
MKKTRLLVLALFIFANIVFAAPKIYIAFLWHMHQPIYYPGEDVVQTTANSHYSYNVTDVFNSRYGPYTSWPKNAVTTAKNAGLTHAGAQVSFSGSLVQNLNRLESAGNGNFTNWKSHWNTIKTQTTGEGNPRIDMVAFGEYHPLMPLIGYEDIRKQIQLHKATFAANFDGSYSKGMFPPENAFAEHIIPALVDEGIEWVMVDNIHFDRTCENYPYSTSGNLYEPNRADVVNADPGDWKQLTNLWAPTQISAGWGHRPHVAEYIDPGTGIPKRIIVVPTSRYLGNEDGRGGFGALLYDEVMSQLQSANTDADHPILVVLHHDGDNYGGGTDSYYGSNFNNFVSWLQANPTRFEFTSVQDYLDRFPPATNDIIHVENGSWAGADNGDPQFRKWLGEPGSSGYSPDRNSWGVITAASNAVRTAEQMGQDAGAVATAWNWLAMGETSCYWYWDGSEGGMWDSHPARAANLAMSQLTGFMTGTDNTPPSIFLPQRDPWNPGGTEFTVQQNSDMTVWTYVHDVRGLARVDLKFREDNDGVNDIHSIDNETYIGGSDVGAWQTVAMTGTAIASQTNPEPFYKAKEYSAQITGKTEVLLDYYVEAEDNDGNIAKSPIQHVWIGQSYSSGGGSQGLSWSPVNPTPDDTITLTIDGVGQGATLHWGVNNWKQPIAVYRPAGSTLWTDNVACRTAFNGPENNTLTVTIGPFNDPAQPVDEINFVINYADFTWDNNNGNDYTITITDQSAIAGTGIHNFLAFPNPGRNMLTLQYQNDLNREMEINIYNLAGKRIYHTNASGTQKNIDINDLPAGMYIISLKESGAINPIRMKYIKL